MPSRRAFLNSLFASSATIPALKNDGLDRIRSAVASIAARTPMETADDEDFWREIQNAFTLDRTLINLNNGGVSPSPRVVQEAMERYLAISNTAPVVTMWQWLEPEIESVRAVDDRDDAASLRHVADPANREDLSRAVRDVAQQDYLGSRRERLLEAPVQIVHTNHRHRERDRF